VLLRLKSISGFSGACGPGAACVLSRAWPATVWISVLDQLSYLQPDSVWEGCSYSEVYIQAGNLEGMEINLML